MLTQVDFRAPNNGDWRRSFTILTSLGTPPWSAVAAWSAGVAYQSSSPPSFVTENGDLYVANPANIPAIWTAASTFTSEATQWIKVGRAGDYATAYFDLTGYTLKMSLAQSAGGNARLTLSSTDGTILIVNAAVGALSFSVPASVVRALPGGDYAYDLLAEKAGSVVRLMFGTVTVDGGITRP